MIRTSIELAPHRALADCGGLLAQFAFAVMDQQREIPTGRDETNIGSSSGGRVDRRGVIAQYVLHVHAEPNEFVLGRIPAKVNASRWIDFDRVLPDQDRTEIKPA